MSDDDTGTDDTTDTGTDDTTDDKGTDTAPTVEELLADRDKWKSMARKHEGTAKANADAARKLAELEAKDKTDAERLADEATQARKEAADARDELARIRVATAKGLSPDLASRLVGTTEDELAEDADRLLALMGPKKKAAPEGGADGGPRGASKPGQLTRADLKTMTPEQIVEARNKGLLDDLMTGATT